MSNPPIIAAMIGDPAGVGPEVCVKAVADPDTTSVCVPLLIGCLDAVKDAARVCGIDRPVVAISSPREAAANPGCIPVIDPGGISKGEWVMGKPSAAAGQAVVRWVRAAEALGASGHISGLVFGPVDSTSLKLSGLVKDIDDLQPPGTYMFRVSGNLRVVPITEHIRLRDIPATVKKERIVELIQMLNSNLKNWGLANPRIAVAGMNCHAMFEEDVEEVLPAVQEAKAAGIDASGPISPDSVFRMVMEGRYDAVVTMYHDQGQIAVKTTAFEGACTIYMGLPYVMLNVPHGTAFDIAGTGRAQHRSFLAALKTASALASGRGFLNGSGTAA